MKHKKQTGLAVSIPRGLLCSACLALLLTILFSSILAQGLKTGRIPFQHSGYVIMGILFTVTYTSCLNTMHQIKHRYLFVCCSSALVYLGILLSITALFFGGEYGPVGNTILLISVGCIAALLTHIVLGKIFLPKTKYK